MDLLWLLLSPYLGFSRSRVSKNTNSLCFFGRRLLSGVD